MFGNFGKGLREKILDKTTLDEKLVGSAVYLKKEVRKHIITAISAAFAFIIALTWRDSIQAGVNIFVSKFGVESEGLFKLITAVVITIICVFGIILVSKFEEKPIDTKKP